MFASNNKRTSDRSLRNTHMKFYKAVQTNHEGFVSLKEPFIWKLRVLLGLIPFFVFCQPAAFTEEAELTEHLLSTWEPHNHFSENCQLVKSNSQRWMNEWMKEWMNECVPGLKITWNVTFYNVFLKSPPLKITWREMHLLEIFIIIIINNILLRIFTETY